MQHPASQPVINPATIDNSLLEEYVAPRFLRKMKSKVSSKLIYFLLNNQIHFSTLGLLVE
jgi:hypothetical protein